MQCHECWKPLTKVTNNLYYCKKCNKLKIANISSYKTFEKTDLRRFELKWYDGRAVIYTRLYQLDLLRIINMCRTHNNTYYAEKFQKLITKIDRHLNETTQYDRDLPRFYLEDTEKWMNS